MRPLTISALAPARRIAPTASARRHKSGSGMAISSARSTAMNVSTPSTVLAICSPMTAGQVYKVAALGQRVPRKSTSFGPKPRTGLVLRLFAES